MEEGKEKKKKLIRAPKRTKNYGRRKRGKKKGSLLGPKQIRRRIKEQKTMEEYKKEAGTSVLWFKLSS